MEKFKELNELNEAIERLNEVTGEYIKAGRTIDEITKRKIKEQRNQAEDLIRRIRI